MELYINRSNSNQIELVCKIYGWGFGVQSVFSETILVV